MSNQITNADDRAAQTAPRRRGRPRKPAPAVLSAGFFDTVPMMRIASVYGTKGMAVAAVVMCAAMSHSGRLEWTERQKWDTLRTLPGTTEAELSEIVHAMVAYGVASEAAFIDHGVIEPADEATERSIQDSRQTTSIATTAEAAPSSRQTARASVVVYDNNGVIYCTQDANVLPTDANRHIPTINGHLNAVKSHLSAENAHLSAENAHLPDSKETETKKETENESTPEPPKVKEKEINKEKETAAVVPTAVSARAKAEADAEHEAEEKAVKKKGSGVDFAMARQCWNMLMRGKGIPCLRAEMTGARRRMFAARCREYGNSVVWMAMQKLSNSTYAQGGGPRGWTADFDWFVRPGNFQKVIDGNFDNERTQHMRRRVVLGGQAATA